MADTKTLWDEVGSGLGGLALKLKLHVEQAGADPSMATDLQKALGELGAAIEGGFSGVANAVRDPSVREDVTKLAESMSNAIAASLSEVGHEVASAVKGSRRPTA